MGSVQLARRIYHGNFYGSDTTNGTHLKGSHTSDSVAFQGNNRYAGIPYTKEVGLSKEIGIRYEGINGTNVELTDVHTHFEWPATADTQSPIYSRPEDFKVKQLVTLDPDIRHTRVPDAFKNNMILTLSGVGSRENSTVPHGIMAVNVTQQEDDSLAEGTINFVNYTTVPAVFFIPIEKDVTLNRYEDDKIPYVFADNKHYIAADNKVYGINTSVDNTNVRTFTPGPQNNLSYFFDASDPEDSRYFPVENTAGRYTTALGDNYNFGTNTDIRFNLPAGVTTTAGSSAMVVSLSDIFGYQITLSSLGAATASRYDSTVPTLPGLTVTETEKYFIVKTKILNDNHFELIRGYNVDVYTNKRTQKIEKVVTYAGVGVKPAITRITDHAGNFLGRDAIYTDFDIGGGEIINIHRGNLVIVEHLLDIPKDEVIVEMVQENDYMQIFTRNAQGNQQFRYFWHRALDTYEYRSEITHGEVKAVTSTGGQTYFIAGDNATLLQASGYTNREITAFIKNPRETIRSASIVEDSGVFTVAVGKGSTCEIFTYGQLEPGTPVARNRQFVFEEGVFENIDILFTETPNMFVIRMNDTASLNEDKLIVGTYTLQENIHWTPEGEVHLHPIEPEESGNVLIPKEVRLDAYIPENSVIEVSFVDSITPKTDPFYVAAERVKVQFTHNDNRKLRKIVVQEATENLSTYAFRELTTRILLRNNNRGSLVTPVLNSASIIFEEITL